MTRLEFVLRFTLSHPTLSSTIVGTSKVDHLRANLAIAAKGPLPSRLYESQTMLNARCAEPLNRRPARFRAGVTHHPDPHASLVAGRVWRETHWREPEEV